MMVTGHQVARRQRRFGNWPLWLLLVLVPLGAWAILAFQAAQARQQAVTTGDTLTDRYLQSLTGQLKTEDLRGNSVFTLADSASWRHLAEVIDGWEPEFGDDPRYWQLVYFHCTVDYYAVDPVDGSRSYPRLAGLEEARWRGVADAATLRRLFENYSRVWLRDCGDSPAMASAIQSKNRAQFQRERRRSIDEIHGAEQEQLLIELAAAAPAEAEPDYIRAFICAERDDLSGAIEYLSKGNRAPLDTGLPEYPFGNWRSDIRDGHLPQDNLLNGIVKLNSRWLLHSNESDLINTLCTEALANKDARALDELHTYLCRAGQRPNQSADALVTIGRMLETVRQNAGRLTAHPNQAQQQVLAELDKRLQQLSAEAYRIQQSTGSLPGALPSRPMGWLFFGLEFAVTRGPMGITSIENLGQGLVDEQIAIRDKVIPLIEEIARFDYTRLAWDEDGS